MSRLGRVLMMACLAAGAELATVPGAPAFAAAAPEPGPATWDTLGVRAVLERRRAALDSLLLPESTTFDTTGVSGAADSLDSGGAAAVQAHLENEKSRKAARPFRFQLAPLTLTTYNRVEGLRLGSGVGLRLGRYARLDAAGAWAFGRRHASGRAALEVGRAVGLGARLAAADLVLPFGPVPEGSSLGLLALVGGEDRQDWLRRRGVALEMWAERRARLRLGVTFFHRRESAVAATTGFSFLGGARPIDLPNPAVDAARSGGAVLAAQLGGEASPAVLDFEIGGAGGDFDYAWQRATLALGRVLPDGTALSLALGGANLAGDAPAQAAAYLGGDATLRGYERLEFAGRRRLTARIELALGIDVLERSRIPLLRRLHVQCVPFADAGSTWGRARAVDVTRGTLDGDWRTSVGLGLRRVLWLPGVEALRLDVVRRTDRDADPWSFWLRVVPLELP